MKMTRDETADSLSNSEEESGGVTEEIWVKNVDTTVMSHGHAPSEDKQGLLWRKKVHTVCLGLVYTCYGLGFSAFGPAFLDLLDIAQVNIEKGSVIVTSVSVGYLAGCLVCGFLLEKVNQDALLFLSTFGTGVFSICLPWIPHLAAMSVLIACSGFCDGLLDTAVNAVCMQIWGEKAGPYMQGICFLFTIGGLLGPLITEPFLMDTANTTFTIIETNSSNLINNSIPSTGNRQPDTMDIPLSQQQETSVWFAFLICGLITVTSSLPFIYLYFKNKPHDKWNRNQEEEDGDGRQVKLTLFSKIVYLSLLALYFLIYISLEDMFITFMAAFIVEYAKLSKSDGANIMSVYWGSCAVSHLLSVLITKILSPWKMILFDFIFLLTTFLLLCFLAHIPAFLWAASALVGLSIASIFPASFAWVEVNIMEVDGRTASLFLISGSLGTVINPLIIGYLFEHHTPMWLVWLLAGECILILLIFFVITILTKFQYGHVSTLKGSELVVDEILLVNRSTDV